MIILQCQLTLNNMNDQYQIKLKIIQIKFDVKFSCVMSLQFQGRTIAKTNRYQNGAFIFDSQIQIQFQQKSSTPFWESNVALKTHRGANYNSGILRLRYSDILNLQTNAKVQINLAKCYDTDAKAELVLIKVIRTNLVSRSEPYLFTHNDDNRNNNQNRVYKNQSADPSSNTSNIDIQRLSVVDEVESNYFKQKIEELQAIITEKSSKIRELQIINAKNYEQANKSRIQLSQIELSSRQRLNQYQSSLVDIQNQLESAHKFIAEKQQEDQERDQEHWAELNRIREEYQNKVFQDISKFKEQLYFLSEQNHLQKQELERKDKNLQEQNRILQEKQQKIKSILSQNEQIKVQLEQLKDKIKQLNNYKATMQLEKQSVYDKYKQAKKEADEAKGMKKSYRILQDELLILKKNADKTVKHKDSVLDKFSLQTKSRIENLQNQLSREIETKRKTQVAYRELSEKYNLLKQKTLDLETKKQEITYQLTCANDKISTFTNELQKCKEKIVSLQGSQVENVNKWKSLQTEVAKLKNQNQILNSKLNEESQKNQQLDQQLQSMQFKVQKHSVESALYLTKSESVHTSCVFKYEQLNQVLIGKQIILEDLSNQNVDLKVRVKENQRIIHQLRLEEAKNRQQLAQTNKRLIEFERKIAKMQKQLRQKQTSVVNMIDDKEKTGQICKQYQRKVEAVTLENFSLQQKNMKNSTIIEQLSTENQQLKFDVRNKNTIIEKHEHGELELRKMMNNEKQKAAKAQNQIRVTKRQFERYVSKIRAEASLVVKLDENVSPVQGIISHYKTSMAKLESQVTSIMTELQHIKSCMSTKDKQIDKLNTELGLRELEISRKQELIQLLKQGLDDKEEQLYSINEDHNQLLSIHEEYIFTFNRYKIDKEEELKTQQNISQQLKSQIEDLESTVERQEKDISGKINEIESLRELGLSNETKAKNLLKQNEKLSSHMQQQAQKSQSQSQKIAKLTNELNSEFQKNQKITLQNDNLVQKIQSLKNGLASNKELTDMMSKAKQKISIQLKSQTEKLLILELEHSALKANLESLEEEKQVYLKNIETLKQNIKILKLKNKQQQEELLSVQSIKLKLQMSNQQKVLLIKELEQSIPQIQLGIKKDQINHEKKIQQLQQKIQRAELEANKLKNQNSELIAELQNKQQEINQYKKQHFEQKINFESKNCDAISRLSSLDEQIAQDSRIKQEQSLRIKQLEKKVGELESEICEKQIQIYSVSGKLAEIEIKWENQQKKLKLIQLRYTQFVQEQVAQHEQKLRELSIQSEKQKHEFKQVESNLKIKQKELLDMKSQVIQLQELNNKKSLVYQEQLDSLNNRFQQKLFKSQKQLGEKETELVKLLKEKKQIQQTMRSELRRLTEKCNTLMAETTQYKEKNRRLENMIEENLKKQEQNKILRMNQRKGMTQDICRELEIYGKSTSSSNQQAKLLKQDQLQQKITKIISLVDE